MSRVVGSGDVVLCTIPTDIGYALFLASGASERVYQRTVEPCVDVPVPRIAVEILHLSIGAPGTHLTTHSEQ